MIYVDLEKIWKKFKNKYKFLSLASVEFIKLMEEVKEDSSAFGKNIYKEVLERTLRSDFNEK